jgi:hypothetical protein
MKQIILSLTLLLSAGILQAQNSFQEGPLLAAANDFEVSTSVEILGNLPMNEADDLYNEDATYENSDLDENIDYLDEVQSPNTPIAIRKYQVMASLYDVTQSYLFDGRNDPFLMVFKTDKGTITTTYNWKGEVLTSEEKFRNVALPADLVRTALKDYKGWRVVRTNYNVSYTKGQDAKKMYTVQITDGKKKKKISMDAEGINL